MEITEEKIKITIRDIMVDFERDFDKMVTRLNKRAYADTSDPWAVTEIPTMTEIKDHDYDLYDRMFTKCWLPSSIGGYRLDMSELYLFKDEIQAISQKISGGKSYDD